MAILTQQRQHLIGASHVVMISHPHAVANLIEKVAAAD